MVDHARFLVHHDGSFLHHHPPPITLAQFVHEVVGCVAGTQVDHVTCHMFSFGDHVPMYPSKLDAAQPVFPDKAHSVNTWKLIRNLKAMSVFDDDPWCAAIEAARARGLTFWSAMRFNDAHPAEYGLCSRFGVGRPEYRLGDRCDAPIHSPDPDGKISACRCLDFSIDQVREHQLMLITEVCSAYDVDGFELDLTRDSGHDFPRTVAHDARREILTNHIAKIRAALGAIGDERGRPLDFAVRVPGTLEACGRAFADVANWIANDLVDVVTPTVNYDTTCELPFDEFVALAANTKCRVYASVTEGVGPGRFRPPPVEAVRAAALNAWRQGVQGINLFNFHHHTISNRVDDVILFSELGDPATLEQKNKLYMIAGIGVISQSRFAGLPYPTAHRHQLPVELPEQPEGPGVTIRLPLGDDLARARQSRMLAELIMTVDLCHVTGAELIEININGDVLSLDEARFDVSTQYPWNWNGQRGHLEARLDLTNRDCLTEGDNEITFTLRQRPSDIADTMVLYAIRLEVRYHAAPFGMIRESRNSQ